jgi:hypothetical protein
LKSLTVRTAYQTPEGIETLRRVLTCYSWKNPDVGYCQGLNLCAGPLSRSTALMACRSIVSAFLMCAGPELT